MIVAIVPVKDNLHYTRGIAEQLSAERIPTLFIDNGSTDGTMDFLLGTEHSVIERPGRNIHEMWNAGIDWALQAHFGATSVAILNNDLKLGPQALQTCDQVLGQLGVLGAVSPNYDGRQIDDGSVARAYGTCGGRYDGTGGFPGFSMVISIPWLKEWDYRFPEDLSWWYGDDDLVKSIEHTGKCVGLVGGVWVEHLDGGSRTGDWMSPEMRALTDADARTFAQRWGLHAPSSH